MLRTLLAPRWLALHALTVAVVAFTVWAGWWQYGAAQEERQREERQSSAVVPLTDLLAPGAALDERDVDRRVEVAGTWTGAQVTVPGRVLESTMGSHVVAALRLADGSSLAVLRGWVPETQKSVDVPAGAVALVGTLRPYETQADSTLAPGTTYDPGELPYAGRDALAETFDLPSGRTYDAVVLLETAQPAPDGPTPVPLDVYAPQQGVGLWQHLSYSAQWWVFGLAALAFWAYQVRQAVRGERQPGDPAEAVEV